MREVPLNSYGQASTTPSPVNRMMAAFARDFRDGVDINLGVGYVNERTIPEHDLAEAVQALIDERAKYRQAFNYGGPKGSPNLIASILAFQERLGIGGLDHDVLQRQQVIIGPNGATSLLEGLADLLEPGIVVTSDPMYYIYCNFLERKGYELLTVPEDDNGLRPDILREKLDQLGERRKRIRFIYVVTVNNPSCSILANDRRRELVAIANELSAELDRKVLLIFDKAYELLIHDPDTPAPESALACDTLGLVYELGTFSKVLAPALRVGYMMGPDSPLLTAMVQKTSDVGFSAPLLNQEVTSYMLDHHIESQMATVNAGYREKAVQVRAWIDQYLGKHLEHCSGGKAGFYFYLTFRTVETVEGSPLFNYLVRCTGDEAVDGPPDNPHPKVVYIPGQFCVHPRGDLATTGRRQLRLSYGFEKPERIHEAIRLMAEAAEAVG